MVDAPVKNPVEEKARLMQDLLLSRPWWELVLRGIFITIFGALALVHLDLTLAVLLVFFGAFVFIEGIFQMVGSFAVKADNPQWVLMFISGLFSFMIGVIVLAWPGMGKLVLLWFIAAWFLMMGTVQLVFGLRSSDDNAKKGMHVIGGTIGITFGLMAFMWPGVTAMGIAWLIGLFAMFFGIQLIVLGLLGRDDENQASAAAVA